MIEAYRALAVTRYFLADFVILNVVLLRWRA
jgi:hypothetical protein